MCLKTERNTFQEDKKKRDILERKGEKKARNMIFKEKKRNDGIRERNVMKER
jgi:hypothetical protein